MEEIIKVDQETMTVSARDLHEKLEIGTKFTTWFERMCEYGFEEGKEFFPKMGETSEMGGRPQTDYEITVDMAKQICMIQRTEKGKEVRQYFIDLEKVWNTPEQVMARALRLADQTIHSLTAQVTEMRPKAEYFDELVDRKLNTNFRDTAKELGVKEKDFINFLMEKKFIYREARKEIRPYAAYTDNGKGLFTLKEYNSMWSDHAGVQTLITPKGRETFRLLCKELMKGADE